IRQAFYSSPDTESACETIHKALLKFISASQPTPHIIIYVDGAWSLEKHETHSKRIEKASKALEKAKKDFGLLEQRVHEGKWPKQASMRFMKSLKQTMTLTDEDKRSLAEYLHAKKWIVITAEYEADVQIAEDCEDSDIVISRDSDMLVYENVSIIWRPISQGRFLVYDINKVCSHLALPSRHHLTALGVVSKNDYNRNIRGLGSASNMSLIKNISIEKDTSSKFSLFFAFPSFILS
ncbi:hypothetical protein BGZ76_007254, partial [Entomortierella beljakovae]